MNRLLCEKSLSPERVTEETVSGAVPVFVNVTICGALVVFTTCTLKLKLAVEALTCAATQVPVSKIRSGFASALSAILIWAVSGPTTDGVNVILSVQLAPAPNVVPHRFVRAKSAAFVPDTAMGLVKFTVSVLLLLVSVTDSAALVVPRAWLGKLSVLPVRPDRVTTGWEMSQNHIS